MPKIRPILEDINKAINDHIEANKDDEVYSQYLKVFNENWDDDEDIIFHLEMLTRLQGLLIEILPACIKYTLQNR